MALSYTTLLFRRNVHLRNFRGLYTSCPLKAATTTPTCMANVVCENHDEKNMRLKRPMSPHLTIYQVQLTAGLSLTHRTTGIILSSYAMVLGLGTLFIPGGIPCLIESIQGLGLPSAVLFVGKILLALPVTFHTFNGFRHLAWDMGQFLTIKEVYSTGYIVTALSVISAVLLAGM